MLQVNPLWCERYRPQTVQETILPESIKKTFQSFVDKKTIPNLILAGTAGVGKTTIAIAMLKELGCDYMIINGSLEGRLIDTLRNQIVDYASSLSLEGGRKYIIIDEGDFLNPATVQPAFRNLMEDLSANCGFIFTCNYKAKIIEPLHSRCSTIEFKIDKEDRQTIAMQIIKRLQFILKEENVTFDLKAVAGVVKKYFPDWRRTINEIQSYASMNNNIDAGILAVSSDGNLDVLYGFMKDKNFTEVRKWLVDNADISPDELFLKMYQTLDSKIQPQSIPEFTIYIAETAKEIPFVANPEISLAAMAVKMMATCNFK